MLLQLSGDKQARLKARDGVVIRLSQEQLLSLVSTMMTQAIPPLLPAELSRCGSEGIRIHT